MKNLSIEEALTFMSRERFHMNEMFTVLCQYVAVKDEEMIAKYTKAALEAIEFVYELDVKQGNSEAETMRNQFIGVVHGITAMKSFIL